MEGDLLSKERFVCMYCQGTFGIEEGAFPQKFKEEYILDADLNNREREEFVCYDCLDDDKGN